MAYTAYTVEEIYWDREPNTEDSWDSGDRKGHVSEVKIVDASDNFYSGYGSSSTDLPFPFFVVYVGYETGSTFGLDFASEVVGIVATEEEAQGLCEAVENAKDFSFSFNDVKYHASWLGYFDRLQSVNYKEFKHGPRPAKGPGRYRKD